MTARTETLASRVAARFADGLQLLPSRSPASCGYEVHAADLLDVCRELRDDPEFCFEQLIDLAGVDFLDYGRDEWSTLELDLAGFSRGVNRIRENDHRAAAGALRRHLSAAVDRRTTGACACVASHPRASRRSSIP